LEISDLIPKAGAIRHLYCDVCGSSMELSFPAFSERVSGVQINISNMPHLRCPECDTLYFPDRSILMIVEIHRQAIENGSNLGSGLIDHSQKMTVAAMQIADMKVCAQRS
jgi:hypothetical protein